ncbi:MAG: polyphosphate kinase 2 [Anaerolineae bacterium]|nr:polyphosphate kinase 2 [Anaerolineae bacterium]
MGNTEKLEDDQKEIQSGKLSANGGSGKKVKKKFYEEEMSRLQIELVKMQEWMRANNDRAIVIFEGRDAAGKGGAIKAITECLNPRYARVAALPKPSDRERGQWYFQRYVAHFPTFGEIVFFDRSWYNRSGVERVMGFCTQEDVEDFFRACPQFERMIVRSGIRLIKYWFSVSDEEQEKRFQARIDDPTKRWKLSDMDLAARSHWVDFSKAKDEMFAYTDTKQCPWWVVNADDKRRARLNCVRHLLEQIPYTDLTPQSIKLPPRQENEHYIRPPMEDQTFIPNFY